MVQTLHTQPHTPKTTMQWEGSGGGRRGRVRRGKGFEEGEGGGGFEVGEGGGRGGFKVEHTTKTKNSQPKNQG